MGATGSLGTLDGDDDGGEPTGSLLDLGRATSAPGAAIEVTVVIPVRNGERTLGQQLEALANQTFAGSWEVIVGDNGSTDDTRDVVATWQDQVSGLQLVDASADIGSSVARNLAAAHARGDKLLFCDADDVVSRDWLGAMADALDRSPVVTSAITYVNDAGIETRLDHAPQYLGRHRFAIGASLGIRRDVFAALGGFDTSIPGVSSTDVEMSLRAARAGYDIGFTPDAEIHKRRREDVADTFHQWLGYGRGGAWIFARHRRLELWPEAIGDQLRTLGWMCAHIANVTTTEGRRRWVRWTAQSMGYADGWFRYRRTPSA
jgi:glycosyltransferase involved in cell wall biosynthesis